MADVLDLDLYRPHISCQDPLTKEVHVLPVGLVEDLASGKTDIQECDKWEQLSRALFSMLLEVVDLDDL